MGSNSIIIPQSFLKQDDVRRMSFYDQVTALKGYISANNKSDILFPYTYYTAVLDRYNPAYFEFMERAKQEQLYFDLRIAYLLLAAKIQQELNFQKHENLAQLQHQQLACQRALSRVNQLLHDQPVILDSPQGSPVNYLYISIGQWLGEKVHEAASGKTKFIQYWLGQINERRLYWIWGGGLLNTVLDQSSIKHLFSNAPDAKKELAAAAPAMGYLSFILYYFRFGVNLSLLLKHTIKHPWMSEEESLTPWNERFKSQWQQRKFMLINDSIWATANLVGFFWLVGSAVKDTSNSLLTVGLLVLDLTLAIWRYWEAETEHNNKLAILKANKEQLIQDIATAEKEYQATKALYDQMLLEAPLLHAEIELWKEQYQSEMDSAKKHKEQLELQKENIGKDIARLEADWKFQKMSLLNNMAYAFGLLVFYSLVAASPLVASLGVIGIAGCFVVTALYNGISAGFDIHKSRTNKKEAGLEIQRLLQIWHEAGDENQKKQIYLQIKDLQTTSEYEKKMLRYQSLKLIRAVLIDAMMPALFFAATVLMPLGIGIAVVAAAITVALISKLLLNALVQPKKEGLVNAEFDQNDYDAFCAKQALRDNQPARSPRLFSSSQKSTDVLDEVPLEPKNP